jgi:hypothetical protein
MEKQEEKAFFDDNSLKLIIAAEGKELKLVICYLWHNEVNKNDVVELIDNIELVFADQSKLLVGSNSDSTGLDVGNFDYESEKTELEKEFEGKIKIFRLNASTTKMWSAVIGKKLESVQLTKEGDKYLSDSIMLNFGEEKRTISISPLDGLIIDYYEE